MRSRITEEDGRSKLIVRYIGLSKALAGVDEDIIFDRVSSLEDVMSILKAKGRVFLENALVANGYTHLGHLMIEMNGKSIDLREIARTPVTESSEISVEIIPTVVGG